MRTCASCGHHNADRLAYCFSCGRRVRPVGVGGDTRSGGRAAMVSPDAPTQALDAAPSLAATFALEALGQPAGHPSPSADTGRHPLARAYRSARYVFTTIRGHMDAEERKRHLLNETEGARRMAEGTLVEIAQTILAQSIAHPALAPLTEAVSRLRARRDTVISDLAAAEKFQAAEDLRLGLLETAAESEWRSFADSAREVEQALGRNETERREAKDAVARHHAARVAGGSAPAADRAALEARSTSLDEQYRTLRERAAALRASSLTAKARHEAATNARRHVAAAVAASVTGHTRERNAIDAELRAVTTQLGARAIEQRVPSPFLTRTYERFDRLQATTRAHQAELARLERSKGGIDRARFAAGLGLILGALGACSAGLWALLR